ncbi:MAG: GntR family transcriptional regulator [Chloroflexota bacterium]|nr:GntR family transcriptional regulator [Chloroflexota bacterium]
MPEKLDKIRLDHNSYISLHVQLHNQLRRLIVSGRWRNGERIPTEMQLSRHLDISRTTVRIATQRLEVEGLIKRSAGRGTFVIYQAQEHAANRSIGYLTCSFHNEIHTNILSSAQTELRSAGYQVIFSNSQDREDEARILQQLLDDEVAGLMLWANAKPTEETASVLAEYERRGIPIVFMDRPIEGVRADYVASDNFGGSYDLVNLLIELGHRHIVQLMPNIDDLHPINDRRRGYTTALEERGIMVHAPWRISQPGRHEFHETDIYSLVGSQSQQIIRQVEQFTDAEGPMPTAIVCINDILAIIAISALRNMGFAVPEDVSVVGFDDISMASHIGVPLTTASQDAYELGKVGSQMLLDRLVGGDLPPRSYTVPTQLRVRASTAAPLVGVEDALQT